MAVVRTDAINDSNIGGLDAFAIVPTDGATIRTCRALYVGGAGNISMVPAGGTAVTFVGVPAGSILPVVCSGVNATATTATNIIGIV